MKKLISKISCLYCKLLRSSSFIFQNKKYKLFYHPYNNTFRNERALEIPLIKDYLEKEKGEILEVGNVLSNYFKVSHDIVDKYDKAPYTINQDIIEFKPKKKYDLIISISTLEHIGFDEEIKDKDKVKVAIKHLKKLLKPNGKIVITIPLGYNYFIDRYIKNKELGLKETYFFKKVGIDIWLKVKEMDFFNIQYNYPFPYANVVLLGVIK